VKANQGAAGVDRQSIAGFEADLSNNLYKLWNRIKRDRTIQMFYAAPSGEPINSGISCRYRWRKRRSGPR
jgi:hypothetical protein